jgi:hypothetical protein
MECGEFAVKTMALLDEANTSHYGHPEVTKVSIGVRKNPAILISGHDLRDMEMLLEQTKIFWCRCLHTLRDVAGKLLSRVQKIRAPRGQTTAAVGGSRTKSSSRSTALL